MKDPMKASVTKPFPGVPDGEVHPVELKVGDVVSGALAEVAVKAGWAMEIKGVVASGSPATPAVKPKKNPRRGKSDVRA